MLSRSYTPPSSSSFFLFGPRAVGKTRYLRDNFPNALYLDLLEDRLFNELTSSTQRLESKVMQSGNSVVIIDEVQKIPRILDEVHRLIETRNIRFILTGSSSRKLKSKGVNLLAGRALTSYMYPLTVEELGNHFELKKALEYGTLPRAIFHENPKAYLESYVATYLKEEVQQEGITRNLGAFARFLEGASFAQGQVLNISDIARQTAIERKTVEQYFIILEDLLLAARLPVFAKRARREMAQHPKFFFFDTGVFRAIRPKGPLDAPQEIDGAALESLLFQELRALNSYHGLGYQLFFWRTKNKLEVDLVAYGERGIVAFEVKRASVVRREDFAGLKAFKHDYPMAKFYLLYGGEQRYEEDEIQVYPYEEALRNLRSLL